MSSARTRACAAVIACGAALGGCSDIYFDRRETVSLGANDADFFMGGKAEIPRKELRAEMGAERPYSGHVLDLPKGGQNVVVSKN